MPKYVDADWLKNAVTYIPWCDYRPIQRLIDEAEGADVEPVRHGRWIPHETDDGFSNGVQCTVCGEWFYKYFTYNYCPDCGAKMDKEE